MIFKLFQTIKQATIKQDVSNKQIAYTKQILRICRNPSNQRIDLLKNTYYQPLQIQTTFIFSKPKNVFEKNQEEETDTITIPSISTRVHRQLPSN